MTFINQERRAKNTFISQKETNIIAGEPINNFLGCTETSNLFNIPLGQLLAIQNMEYLYSGNKTYLQTKRGSTLIADITYRSMGVGLYVYNLADEFIVWVDNLGNLKRMGIDGGTITTITTGLSAVKEHFFYNFGLNTYSALYGTNSTDGIYKVSGSTPSFALITNSPKAVAIAYSTNCGRLIGVANHTMFYSEVQSAVGSTANLEDFGWNGATSWWDNSNQISEDSGTGFVQCVELNGVMCLFKDTGIWGLVNSKEAPLDWYFPKLSSNTGTKSPKTVSLCQFGSLKNEGIIFLGADKTLRILDIQVDMNSGKIPSLSTKNSHIISKHFQNILDQIPDGYLDECTGYYWNGYYFLNIVSTNGTQIDTMLVIDLLKLLPLEVGDTVNQPFWFKAINMDNVNYLTITSNNQLYGFNINGYVSRLFVNDKYVEEMPTRIIPTQSYTDSGTTRSVAIEYNFYTAWNKYSNNELLLEGFYLNWNSDGDWDINITANSFKKGDVVPNYNANIFTGTLTPSNSGLSYWDVFLWDVDPWSDNSSNISQRTDLSLRGHYFNFGVYSTAQNQWAKFYSIEPMFKMVRNDILGLRI